MQNPDPVDQAAEGIIQFFDIIDKSIAFYWNPLPINTLTTKLLYMLNINLFIYTIESGFGQEFQKVRICKPCFQDNIAVLK